MTGILLDTHAFLWFVFDDTRLSPTAAATIENTNVTKFLSTISLWEIVIKSQIGKLRLGMNLEDFFDRHISNRELELVDIKLSHLLAYNALPLMHRDPFDRLLTAQARVMNVPILSSDSMLAQYEIKVVW